MKTLQIVGNSAFGGATYLILRWCRYLIERGCAVDVIATDRQTVKHLEEIEGVKIIRDIFIPREISLKHDSLAFFKLIRLLLREQYEIVHTYTATPGFIGRISGFLARTPVVLHHQAGWTVNEYSTIGEKLLFAPLENIVSRLGTKSICVGSGVAEQAQLFRLAPQSKLVIIANGIDASPFVNDEKTFRLHIQLGLPKNVLLIGSTSRLSTQKDLATLLHAFAMARENLQQEAHLILAGEGPARDHLIALARSLGIHNCTHFPGFISDVPGFLRDIDIFVSTSLREGLSISILEAMAAARSIIATNILPNAELIQDGETGLLVPPKDPDALQRAIVKLAQDEETRVRLGKAARRRVMEKYTLQRMFEQTWELYEFLLSEKQCKNYASI